jgi:hypothetical protein
MLISDGRELHHTRSEGERVREVLRDGRATQVDAIQLSLPQCVLIHIFNSPGGTIC